MATRWCVYLGGGGGIVPRAGGSGGGGGGGFGIVPQAGGGGDVVRLVDVGASRVAFAPRVTHFNPPALTTRDSRFIYARFYNSGLGSGLLRGLRRGGCGRNWGLIFFLNIRLCVGGGFVCMGSWWGLRG